MNSIVPWQPQPNNIYHMDALTLLRHMPDDSVDLLFMDPPYGLGVDTWDKPIDIDALMPDIERVIKPTGFVAYTLMMPTLLHWMLAFDNTGLQLKDQVIWLKRAINVTNGLQRTFENLMIYRKPQARYVNTRGLYSDVRVPGLMFDAIAIEGIQRHIADLRVQIKTGRSASIIGKTRHHDVYQSRYTFDGERAPEHVNFTNVWSFLPTNNKHKGQSVHATQKPVMLLERLIDLCTHADAIVLDPFMGSGTTAVAAQNLGRQYIGCDISAEYVEIARRRVQNADPYQQTTLDNGLVQKSLFAEVMHE